MRYLFLSLIIILNIVFISLSLSSCTQEEDVYEKMKREASSIDSYDKHPYIKNAPLKKSSGTYKILAIGNSYTIDGTAYIQDLLDSAHISREEYTIYQVTATSASLEDWAQKIRNNKEVSITLAAGKELFSNRKQTFYDIISNDWDVIVLQQVSYNAVNYHTYNPNLRDILNYIKVNCQNKNIAFAWQQVHSYWTGFSNQGELKGEKRWKSIVYSTQIMKTIDGIDIIIPTGTAIENARHTSLQTKYDLTRDGTHLCFGAGRYIAACVWVHSLFTPVFDISILNNDCIHPIKHWEEDDKQTNSFLVGSSVPVTNNNRKLCQKCAFYACTEWRDITFIEENDSATTLQWQCFK